LIRIGKAVIHMMLFIEVLPRESLGLR